jgi:hypothetical protein
MARVYNRKEGTLNYEAGVQKTLELSRNYHVMKYILKLEVNVTNAGSGVTYYDNNLFRLISSLNLVANGSLNIKQLPAEKLIYNSIYDNGRVIYTKIDPASGAKKQVQVAEINLIIPNEVRPLDTILNTKVFDTLNLNVVWADASAIGTGITITDANLSVSSHQIVGYKRNANENVKYFKEVASNYNVTADNNNYLIKLDPNQFYTGFLLTTKDADGLLQDNLITNIRTT